MGSWERYSWATEHCWLTPEQKQLEQPVAGSVPRPKVPERHRSQWLPSTFVCDDGHSGY